MVTNAFPTSFRSLLWLVVLSVVLVFGTTSAKADIVSFILTGAAGEGLLEGNIDPATGEPGTGGIGMTGITLNTNTNILHVDLEWGSANGYTDLSQAVDRVHLHGPTDGAGTGAFGQTAPLLVTLSNTTDYDASASAGFLNGNFFIDNDDIQAVLDGRTYINVHLTPTDTGAIRGYLLAVPEPSAAT